MLTRTSNCRVFQGKTVPEIVKEVCATHGFTDIEDRLDSGVYRKWEYCVQYRETDFNFISRLIEQEGIYYFFNHYFEHDEGRHDMVLMDSLSRHETASIIAGPLCQKIEANGRTVPCQCSAIVQHSTWPVAVITGN